MDPHSENYYSWSPYVYVGNNPMKFIDPDGRDIIILKNSGGARGMGHAALLIGKEGKGWTYISKDGYTGNSIMSTSKYVVKSFESLKDFKSSAHNYELKSGTHSTAKGEEAENFDFKRDDNGKKIERYDESILIETTQKDGTSTDSKTIDAATKSAKSVYALGRQDCSHVVTEGLNVSKNAKGEQIKNGEGGTTLRPNTKFEKIKEDNGL